MAIDFGIAGQRDDVARRERRAGGDDLPPDVGEEHAVAVLVEVLVPPGVLDRLEGDAAHAIPAKREVDDLADLVLVGAALHHHHQRGRDAFPLERLERLNPDAREVGAAERLQRGGPERIELEIDLEAGLEFRERGGEIGLPRDPDAVGVEHDVADRLRLGERDDVENLRVDGRLAAGDLHEVGHAFARDQRVEHEIDLGERPVQRALGARIGEADRAGEVARLVDVDQREAGVLLVVRAEAAIVGAAELGPRLHLERPVARLDVVARQAEIGGVGRDQRLLHAVPLAAL